MTPRVAIFLLLGMAASVPAQTGKATQTAALPTPVGGILQSIDNASIAPGVSVSSAGHDLLVTRTNPHTPITLTFAPSQALGLHQTDNQWWILPLSPATTQIDANRALWILPLDPTSPDHAWHLTLNNGTLHAQQTATALTVAVEAGSLTLSRAEGRPHADPFGHRFTLDVDGGPAFEQALASFYWGTMLPSVVEKTMAANFPYSSGYVLSTLNVRSYAGSYPAVDHEFQIKGRLAFASELDLDIVRRMIELQFRLMNDDPERLFRAPTSVQPNGTREYHVRRNSQDNHQNAAMFPLTGNIEVIEEASRYDAARKDLAWLRANIENLEHAAAWILANTDQYGRVWSDVYYEDQVMKDGRETEAQAFAAHAFELLAALETRLGRHDKAATYSANARLMAAALIAPLPTGYWDADNHRFTDWVDRNGKVHDHLHLLANELPVTFAYATADQSAAVRQLVDANAAEFERFPSFLSASIADYDKSEIGDGGPYDLCAAGRYWYWDAAYAASLHHDNLLFDQLQAVAAEAAANHSFLSERYDMDHVYYIDGKHAHGAEKYYEYPNVFTAVLIEKYLGLTLPPDADVSVAPHLKGSGTVSFELPRYALRYTVNQDGFVLNNLSDKPRRYNIDLSALGLTTHRYRLHSPSVNLLVDAHSTLTLPPHGEGRWTPVP